MIIMKKLKSLLMDKLLWNIKLPDNSLLGCLGNFGKRTLQTVGLPL